MKTENPAYSLPLLIFGAGGLAAEIVDMVTRIGTMRIAGLVVDRVGGAAAPAGFPVYHWTDISEWGADYLAVNGIGSPKRRAFIESAEAKNFKFVTLIDPSAQIFPSAKIGEGSVIGAGCIVAAQARLGRHVFLNRATTIGHHADVGDFASCYAAVNVGSFSRLGATAEIGIGAVIIDRINIGDGAMIGAGSVVIRDCPPGARLVGVPAHPIGS